MSLRTKEYSSPERSLGEGDREAAEGAGPLRRALRARHLPRASRWGGKRASAITITCILCSCTLVAACGLHPLYATNPVDGGGARQVFSTIYVDPIGGENIGYELRNTLIDGLEGAPRPTQAAYRLRVTVSQYLQGIAVANNAVVTRYNYTLDANYELSDIHTNKTLKSGVEETLSAYDVVTSPYATLRAQRDAQRRGAQDIADRIRMALSAYFAKHPAAK